MAGELIAFGNRIRQITDPATLHRIALAAGMAGKVAGLETAASDLGGDRAFSGMARKVSLGVGFDELGTMVRINYRPAGLWILAEKGRSAGKPIFPRRAQALSTPDGPRARSTVGYWGGKGTWSSAVRKARTVVPRAAAKQFSAEVAKIAR